MLDSGNASCLTAGSLSSFERPASSVDTSIHTHNRPFIV